MNALPSKKVLSILILTLSVVAAIIIAFGRDKSSTAINFASDLVAGDKISVPENPNWQNELTGIKPIQISEESPVVAAEPSTVTDTVSTGLISNYLALKQSGNLDGDSAQKLVDQSLDYISQSGANKVTPITESGLRVIADNGNQTIKAYGENLGTAIKNKKPSDIKKEIELITKIISSRSASGTAELNPIIASYEKVYANLLKMPVPKTFVKAHLDMANGANEMIVALKEIGQVQTDPFKALLALQLYQTSMIRLSKSMQATISFIILNKVVYKQGSGGYYLLYGI